MHVARLLTRLLVRLVFAIQVVYKLTNLHNKAKQTFEETFPDVKVEMYYQSPSFYVVAGRYLTKEEAIIELWRFRTVFPKAITQSREVDISEFIVRPELEVIEPELEDDDEE